MAGTPFLKMHGLGNDVVVLDARAHALDLTPLRRRAIADHRRHLGARERRQAARGPQPIERGGQIRYGIDQCAIEIE